MNNKNFKTDISLIADVISGISKENLQTNKGEDLYHQFNFGKRLMPVRSVSVTPNNKFLIITYAESPKIRIIDLSKLEFMPYKYDAHYRTVRLVSPTPDSTGFYTASWDGCFNYFNILDGTSKQLFCGNRSPSVFLDYKLKYLFVAEYPDNSIHNYNVGKCWDLRLNKIIAVYRHINERTMPQSIDIAYDQVHVFTGGDGKLYRWDLYNIKPAKIYFESPYGIRKITISKTLVAAASMDGIVRVFNKLSGESRKNLNHKCEVTDIRISEDEQFLFSAAIDGTIKCFNLNTGIEIYCQKVHEGWIWSICLFNSGKTIVSAGTDGFVAFSNTSDGKLIARLYNFSNYENLLIEAPKEKTFPYGFFYTNNTDLIQVISKNENQVEMEELKMGDQRRNSYIKKLNLKNLMITNLKNNEHYISLKNNFMQNQKRISGLNLKRISKSLKA